MVLKASANREKIAPVKHPSASLSFRFLQRTPAQNKCFRKKSLDTFICLSGKLDIAKQCTQRVIDWSCLWSTPSNRK